MLRPVDWSPVGLGSDPTPGDPVVVRDGGRHYVGVADALAGSAALLRAMGAGASSGSESVAALLERARGLADDVGRAEGRYRAAGDALVQYAYALDRVQSTTARALAEARAARREAAAQRRLAAMWAREAGDAPTPDDQASCARRSRQAAACARDADSLAEAHARVVEQAVAERDAAGRHAAEQIREATAADGLNDSFWDDVGAPVVKLVAAVAEKVATIAGTLALVLCWVPVLGQFLLAVAAVAGVLAALANIVLAAAGEQSWTDAVVSVVFAALGCVGLGGLRGVLGALRAGKGIAAGAKALGGAKGVLGATKAGWTTLAKAQKGLFDNKFVTVFKQFRTPKPVNEVPPYGTIGRKTSGTLIRPDGTESALRSGKTGPTQNLPNGKTGMNGNVKWHVEGHAASLMRLENLSRSTLLINRLACSGPYGCEQLLPLMLPKGCALTAHVVPNGSKATPIVTVLIIGIGKL